eukprot:1151768-Pelagomonas_calceolata.AAC.4
MTVLTSWVTSGSSLSLTTPQPYLFSHYTAHLYPPFTPPCTSIRMLISLGSRVHACSGGVHTSWDLLSIAALLIHDLVQALAITAEAGVLDTAKRATFSPSGRLFTGRLQLLQHFLRLAHYPADLFLEQLSVLPPVLGGINVCRGLVVRG